MTATVSASTLALHLNCSRTYIAKLEAVARRHCWHRADASVEPACAVRAAW